MNNNIVKLNKNETSMVSGGNGLLKSAGTGAVIGAGSGAALGGAGVVYGIFGSGVLELGASASILIRAIALSSFQVITPLIFGGAVVGLGFGVVSYGAYKLVSGISSYDYKASNTTDISFMPVMAMS